MIILYRVSRYKIKLKKQQLLGIMTGVLKHSRDRDITNYVLELMADMVISIDLTNPLALDLVRTALNYLLNVGNIADPKQFIEQVRQLPVSVRGEFMTAAEQLKDSSKMNDLLRTHQTQPPLKPISKIEVDLTIGIK